MSVIRVTIATEAERGFPVDELATMVATLEVGAKFLSRARMGRKQMKNIAPKPEPKWKSTAAPI